MMANESSSFLMMMMIGNLISSIFLTLIKPAILAINNRKTLIHLFESIFFIVLSLIRSLPLFYYPQKRSRGGGFGKKLVVADGSIPAVARALNQLLSSLNDIPVSSRKYEMVRSLAEKLIEENGLDGLNQLNSRALSAAFGDTLRRLEKVTVDATGEDGGGGGLRRFVIRSGFGGSWSTIRLVWRVGKWSRDLALRSLLPNRSLVRGGEGIVPVGTATVLVEEEDCKVGLAEKLVAELLWLAEKWVACDGAVAAVEKWGSASRLARISLFAWPRLQGGLVKITAFLIRHAKDLEKSREPNNDDGEKEQHREEEKEEKQMVVDRIKVRMVVSWLPLLCRGINGTDTPILSTTERGEVERALQEMIESLQEDSEKERVLSTWLHYFVRCSSSDWPNLYGYYLRWCDDSRKQYLYSCNQKAEI